MTITAIDVRTIEPLAHEEAMRRQTQELDRTLALLRAEAAAYRPGRPDEPRSVRQKIF